MLECIPGVFSPFSQIIFGFCYTLFFCSSKRFLEGRETDADDISREEIVFGG